MTEHEENIAFQDRSEAGRTLAALLASHSGASPAMVLAIPRRGVPVAVEVARSLGLPLDVLAIEKVSVWHDSWQQIRAAGAVAGPGVQAVNPDVVSALHVSPEDLEEALALAHQEQARKEWRYRGPGPFPDIRARTVILVDDAIETGATMRAAIQAVRAHDPASIVVAAPMGSAKACAELKHLAQEVVCPVEVGEFTPVHDCYRTSPPLTDEEVRGLLEENRRSVARFAGFL
jgi:predicted phosphoribosyltransferase